MSEILIQREVNVKFNGQEYQYELKKVSGQTCEIIDRYTGLGKSCLIADLELDLIDLNLVLNDIASTKFKVDRKSTEYKILNDSENALFNLVTKCLLKMGFTPTQCTVIEGKAYEDGHAYGCAEVLLKVIDYSDFAKLILGK